MTTGHPTAPSFIAGEQVLATKTFPVTDPHDGKVIARVSDAGAELAAEAAEAADAVQPAWAALPLATRKALLAGAADRLQRRRDRLVSLAIADTGARRSVAEAMQVDAAIARLRGWAEWGEESLEVPLPADGSGRVRVRRQPLGVVACISPYNFPLLAMVAKVAPALFAGNTVVMKPAPQDPLLVIELAAALIDVAAEVGVPPGVVNLVVGETPASGQALVAHEAVRAVSFTGSTTVGVDIHRSAAPTMKRLLLELGGKGALVVRGDADVAAAVAAATRTWTYHAGQVCLTPARVLAYPSVYDEVASGLRAVLREVRHGDPRDPNTGVAPLISVQQRDRVATMVQRAAEQGAAVDTSSGAPHQGGHHPAVLVTDVTAEHEVMQEEVFGPVIALARVDDDEDAIRVANSTKYALTDYVFSADIEAAERLAAQLDAAQVAINTTQRRPDAPFGGNKMSGVGRSGGLFALDAYTNLQTTTLG